MPGQRKGRPEGSYLVDWEQWEQHVGRLAVPSGVAVDGDRVVWSDVAIPGARQAWTRKARPPTLLTEFVRLADAEPAVIDRFASNYGPLQLCKRHRLPWKTHAGEHGLPCELVSVAYRPSADPAQRQLEIDLSTDSILRLLLVEGDPPPRPVYQEDLQDWREYARSFGAALRLADGLRRGQIGEANDWLHVYQPVPRQAYPVADEIARQVPPDKLRYVPTEPVPDEPWVPPSLLVGRHKLSEAINEWLEDGGVRPWLAWTRDPAPRFVFGGGAWTEGGDLFGALVWELALAAGRSDQLLVTCTGCFQPYQPRRMPGPNQPRHYCLDCRDAGIPERDKKRRQRGKGRP